MNIPAALKSPISLISIGFLIGGGVISMIFVYLVNIEKARASYEARQANWLEADKFLTIAKSIRNKKYNEALSFSESMLNLNLINITGSGVSNYTHHELYILKEIEAYKEKECSLECMERLSGKYK